MKRPANPRLTRDEKAALLSISERGYIVWRLGIQVKSSEMVTRLARKGLLQRNSDGSATRWLTRKARLLLRRLKFKSGEPRAVYRASIANPKAGRSHIARKLGYDGFGFLSHLDQLDPEMRP